MARKRKSPGASKKTRQAELGQAMQDAHAWEEEWFLLDVLRGSPLPRCHICRARLDHDLLKRCVWCGAERRYENEHTSVAGAV